jgi:hypothetical protein
MYDTPEYVKQAMDQLVPLYQNAGKASPASNFIGAAQRAPCNGRRGSSSVISLNSLRKTTKF